MNSRSCCGVAQVPLRPSTFLLAGGFGFSAHKRFGHASFLFVLLVVPLLVDRLLASGSRSGASDQRRDTTSYALVVNDDGAADLVREIAA